MKKFLIFFGAIVILLVAIVLFRTYTQPDLQPQLQAQVIDIEVSDSAVYHLRSAIQFKTISHHPAMMDKDVFTRLGAWMRYTYPEFFAIAEVDTISTHTYVIKWPGSDSSSGLPILLMGHQDVVPSDASNRDKWHQDPFSGAIDSGYVYGRGTLDDKGSIVGLLEAAQTLIESGFTPKRDIYFVFGQDEEIGGANGAQQAAIYFEEQGLRFDWVLDEGGIIADGILPGIDGKVGLIGVSEKGYISVDITAEYPGGHSSMPADTSALMILTDAVQLLREEGFKPTLEGPMSGFLDYLGPRADFTTRMAASNMWLFRSVIKKKYQGSPAGAALVRTTFAPTIMRAGVKDNVIPSRAVLTCNSRVMPGSSAQEVLEHYKDVLKDLPVEISIHDNLAVDPSPVSDYMGESFNFIGAAARTTFSSDNLLIAPYLVVGATDARHMRTVSDNLYRFTPFKYKQEDLGRLHGINERLSIENFEDGIRFYMQLMSGL